MIGKSYDGTFANGTAATGVEGLTTIVPISAISAWYNYSRTARRPPQHQLPERALEQHRRRQRRHRVPPADGPDPDRRRSPGKRSAHRSATAQDMLDGDEHGDINEFWRDRDHNKDASKVKASVFIVHGFQDDNVRMDHVGLWWDALKANNVRTKLWLLRAGHTDPFEQRRAEWVDTLHRWFDQELQGINNGIGAEPARHDRGRAERLEATTPTGRSRARRTPTCTCAAGPATTARARSAASSAAARPTR